MYKLYFSLGALVLAAFLSACGGPAENVNANGNTNASNVNAAKPANSNVIANSPVGTTVKPEGDKLNDAPTLAPVVHAYYDALKKKDTAALKETMTSNFIKMSEEKMKEDGAKDLAAYMAEFDNVPDKPMQVRNERIDGDMATVELLGGDYAKWTPFQLAKEGGKWKFTGGSPDLKTVTGK